MYAIIALSQQVDDTNNVLTSRATDESIARGQLFSAKNLTDLFSMGSNAAVELDKVVIPGKDDDYKVAQIRVSPTSGARIVTDTGEIIYVGLDVTASVTSRNVSEAADRRRLHLLDDGQIIVDIMPIVGVGPAVQSEVALIPWIAIVFCMKQHESTCTSFETNIPGGSHAIIYSLQR